MDWRSAIGKCGTLLWFEGRRSSLGSLDSRNPRHIRSAGSMASLFDFRIFEGAA